MIFPGKLKTCFISVFVVAVVAGIVLMYACSHKVCHKNVSAMTFVSSFTANNARQASKTSTSVFKPYPFDFEGNDVIVFLHMQKTGGTKFGKHLVQNLETNSPCECIPKRKRCTCERPNSKNVWLFSRFSLGWPCGLHADWTELQACVPRYMNNHEGKKSTRKYLYITILREPVPRFVSEFHCYQRGATWKNSLHMCNGRVPSKKELPPCYKGQNWTDVTLQQFLGCSSNLAFNRQTRMLADLKLVGCYDTTAMPRDQREKVLLDSAKKNLESMPYFALVEHQTESQYLFERTFGMKFRRPFMQMSVEETRAGAITVDAQNFTRIQELNSLDIKLYSFAKRLFFERLEHLKAKDGENTQTTIKDSYD